MAWFLGSKSGGLADDQGADLYAQAFPGWYSKLPFMTDQREAFVFTTSSLESFQAQESSLEVALRVVGQVADRYTYDHAELVAKKSRWTG